MKKFIDRLDKGDLIVCVRGQSGEISDRKYGEKGIVKYNKKQENNGALTYQEVSKTLGFISISSAAGPRNLGYFNHYRYGSQNWIFKAARYELGYSIQSWNADTGYRQDDVVDKVDEIKQNYDLKNKVKLFLKFHRIQSSSCSYRVWKITEDQLTNEELKIYKEIKNQTDL